MVRKVGFEDERPDKGVADRVLDQHRAKARARKAAEARERAEATERRKGSTPANGRSTFGRVFGILFLTVWLTLWTGGIVMVAFIVLSGDVHAGPLVFMLIWEVIAIFAWFAAVRSLIRMFRGQ